MFLIVCRDKIMGRCRTIEEIPAAIASVSKELESTPSNAAWGHKVDVFFFISGYTTRPMESWPKEKNYDINIHNATLRVQDV